MFSICDVVSQCRSIFIYSVFLLAAVGVNVAVVVVPVLGGVAVIALGILAGVVGGYMWKKKNTKNGKI